MVSEKDKKKLQKGLQIKDEEISRCMATPYTIDTNRRRRFGEEPKMKE